MRHLNWTIKIGSDYKVFCSRQMPQFYLSKNLLHHHLDKEEKNWDIAPWLFASLPFCFCPFEMFITTWLNECKCKNRFCKQGFDDALRFLQQRGLITCTLCMTVESFYQLGIISDNWTSLFACQPIFQIQNMTSVYNVWSRMSAQKIVKFLRMSRKCLTKFRRERDRTREGAGGTKTQALLRVFSRSKFSIWCAFRCCCGWK